MDKKQLSDKLSTSTVRKVMPACMVFAIVQSMTFAVDTILSGNLLGEDAVAAVALGMPIIGMMLAVTSLVMHGGFLKMLGHLGKSDMDGYNRMFSITMTLTVVIDIVFVALCLLAPDAIMNIAGGSQIAGTTIAELGRLYIRTACLMIIFFAVGTVFQIVSATYGYQGDRMISSVINVVLNIVISVVMIKALPAESKIAGLGIGSAAGAFSQMVVSFIFIKTRKIKLKFRFFALNKRNLLDIGDCFRRGLPASIDTILDSTSATIVNRIILAIFTANGTVVLALVAMIKTIGTLVRTVGRGSLYAGEPLFGILHGERDNKGVCKTFKFTTALGVAYAIGLAAVLIALRNPILNFYHLVDSADAHMGIILVAISGIVSVFPFMFNAVYESTGHLTLSLIMSVIPDSILYPVFVAILGRPIGVTGIWLAYGFAFIPFFIVYYLIFMLVNKKAIVPLERLLMLKKYKDRETAIDISIPVTSDDVSFVSESLQKFFLENNTSERTAFISALCMEEIAADYQTYRKEHGKPDKKAYMDIKAFRDPEKIEIILRNYDKPYNPLVIEKDGIEDGSFSKIGIVMVQKTASNVLYSYAYHLNVVTITIPTA